MNDYARAPNQPLNTTSSPTFAGLTINGAATFAATVTATGQFLGGDGSAAAPSYSFTNDTNTGIYRSNADELAFVTGGAGRWAFTASGHFLAGTDNAYDIGASGATRPRNVYAGTKFILSAPGGQIDWESTLSIRSPITDYFRIQSYNAAKVVDLGVLASASLQLGYTPSATPVAQTFTIGEASRPGTDSNVGGANGTIRSGLGTGTGAASSLIFQTPSLAGSGSGVQSYATRLTITAGAFTVVGNILADGDIRAGSGGYFYFNARSSIGAPSDGVLTLNNNALSDFSRLCFGGTTLAFPALKRSGTTIQVRVADDTGYGSLAAYDFQMFGNALYDALANKVVGAQGAAVADASGGATVDAEARTAINTLLARLRAHGLIST